MKQSSFKNNLTSGFRNLPLKFLAIAIFVFASFISNPIKSQIKVNFNVPSQPLWGPVGYDYANYYYLPEADVFYSVPQHKFFYSEGNKWVAVNNLPPKYNVDLFNTYKIVVNKPKPYLNHGYYVSNYAKYKHESPKQIIIRESDEPKYYKVKGHPKHDKAGKGKEHDNGKHHGKKGNK